MSRSDRYRETIRSLANKEKSWADTEIGPFHSEHEAWAVIREELIEATDEAELSAQALSRMDNCIRDTETRDPGEVTVYAETIREHAIRGACELIQVASCAMRLMDLEEGEYHSVVHNGRRSK